jgi:hypothetical protein
VNKTVTKLIGKMLRLSRRYLELLSVEKRHLWQYFKSNTAINIAFLPEVNIYGKMTNFLLKLTFTNKKILSVAHCLIGLKKSNAKKVLPIGLTH